MLWGSDKPTTVRCRKCGSILKPGAAREVRRLSAGRWEHVECRTAARVARGSRGLERLLRGSVSGAMVNKEGRA
jgi:RNase P subunit RPR2